MKLLGFIIVAVSIVTFDKLLGFSDAATIVGLVIGAGSYLLINCSN